MADPNVRTAVYSRNLFSPEEADLYELAQLSGVTLDPNVFKIVTDLLRLNAHPAAIIEVLRRMCGSSRRRVRGSSGGSSGEGSSRKAHSDGSPSVASHSAHGASVASMGSAGSAENVSRPRISASASNLSRSRDSLRNPV